MADKDEVKLEIEAGPEALQPEPAPKEDSKQPADKESAFEQLKKSVSEDDDEPIGSLTLRKVLGGDILSAQMVRSQVWLIMFVSLFITIYVAMRYQCQQDMLDISKLEQRLTDAKYKALSSSSTLTEKSRESHVTKALRANNDTLLTSSDQPPFIVNVEE